jgi:hypothetical protein
MRRVLSLVLAGLLLSGIGYAVYANRRDRIPANLKPVTGVISSEKKAFFDDEDVKRAFWKAGLDVRVDTAGSRAIGTTVKLDDYDFAFPGGTPAAAKIQKEKSVATSYAPFFTPMAIATFTPIANLLQKAGVAQRTSAGWTFDMKAFGELTKKGTRWNELPGNTTYPVSKYVLITSTDIATSNSAAMYAAMASYVANDGNVVVTTEQAKEVVGEIEHLFTRQGFAEESEEAPFEDYIAIGLGKTPLVMIYESQFVARAARQDGSIRSDMVLMYPDPDVLSKSTLVPLTPDGDIVGRLLRDDEDLQREAVEHGFRTPNRQAFADFVKAKKVKVAPEVLNIIEPPTYETLEAIIVDIAKKLHGPNAARVGQIGGGN